MSITTLHAHCIKPSGMMTPPPAYVARVYTVKSLRMTEITKRGYHVTNTLAQASQVPTHIDQRGLAFSSKKATCYAPPTTVHAPN